MKGACMDNKTHENALKKVYGKSKTLLQVRKHFLSGQKHFSLGQNGLKKVQ